MADYKSAFFSLQNVRNSKFLTSSPLVTKRPDQANRCFNFVTFSYLISLLKLHDIILPRCKKIFQKVAKNFLHSEQYSELYLCCFNEMIT